MGFLGGFGIGQVLLVTVIAVAFSALAPTATATIAELNNSRVRRSLWIGFLTLSALTGGAIVLAMTFIGLLVTPLVAILVLLTALSGLVAGSYGLGVRLTRLAGRSAALTKTAVLRDALAGSITTALILVIPFVGWIALCLVVLFGIGLLTNWLFQPRFFAAETAPKVGTA